MRNPTIEVLRCLLMFFIVLYHGCNNKPDIPVWSGMTVKLVPWFLFFCTNSFMFISGWFGIRLSLKRVVRFLWMGAFSVIILGFASKSVMGYWCWKLSLGWFGTSYLAVMFLSPIVNAGLESLEQSSHRSLLVAWGAFAVAVFVSWLPIGLTVPGWCGHGFSTMLFIYVSARVIRLLKLESRISTHLAALIFLVSLGIHLARLAVIVLYPTVKDIFILTGDYDSPEMLLMGASFFMMMYRMRFPNWLNQTCLWLAPSMFVVYLLHTGGGAGSKLYDRLILYLADWFPLGSFFSIMVGAIVMFSLCLAIDMLRRFLQNVCCAILRKSDEHAC